MPWPYSLLLHSSLFHFTRSACVSLWSFMLARLSEQESDNLAYLSEFSEYMAIYRFFEYMAKHAADRCSYIRTLV